MRSFATRLATIGVAGLLAAASTVAGFRRDPAETDRAGTS